MTQTSNHSHDSIAACSKWHNHKMDHSTPRQAWVSGQKRPGGRAAKASIELGLFTTHWKPRSFGLNLRSHPFFGSLPKDLLNVLHVNSLRLFGTLVKVRIPLSWNEWEKPCAVQYTQHVIHALFKDFNIVIDSPPCIRTERTSWESACRALAGLIPDLARLGLSKNEDIPKSHREAWLCLIEGEHDTYRSDSGLRWHKGCLSLWSHFHKQTSGWFRLSRQHSRIGCHGGKLWR